MIRRRWLPAVAGGLVAVSAAVAAVATLGGAHHGTDSEPAVLASAGAAVSTGMARAAAGIGGNAASSGPPESSGSQGSAGAPPSTPPPGPGLAGESATRLVVPDVIASVPGGLTPADLDRIKRLSGVRAVLAIDGAQITVNGARLTVLAAPETALRPWTPPATATSTRVWSAFRAGHLITTGQAAAAAHLARGRTYPVAAAVRARIADGGTALLGVAGVDGVVNQAEGRKLGLVKNVAVLVNAPAVDMTALVSQVRTALGGGAQVIRLVPVAVSAPLPVDNTTST